MLHGGDLSSRSKYFRKLSLSPGVKFQPERLEKVKTNPCRSSTIGVTYTHVEHECLPPVSSIACQSRWLSGDGRQHPLACPTYPHALIRLTLLAPDSALRRRRSLLAVTTLTVSLRSSQAGEGQRREKLRQYGATISRIPWAMIVVRRVMGALPRRHSRQQDTTRSAEARFRTALQSSSGGRSRRGSWF